MRARRAPGGGAQVWPRVPTARAGGGRPRRGRAGREPRETWLESGSLRGLGVPPQLAGGGPVSRFPAPSLEWRCAPSEPTALRAGGEGGSRSGREAAERGRTAGLGWPGPGLGQAAPGGGGRGARERGGRPQPGLGLGGRGALIGPRAAE